MSVKTLIQLSTEITVIANETAAGGNTKTRIAGVLQDIADSIASLGATDLTSLTASIASLSTAVSQKQATLVSGTNIKTINGVSLLGSADISTAVAVDEYHEYANLGAFPVTGLSDVAYLAIDTSKLYRWTGSAYAEISPSITTYLEFVNLAAFPGTGTVGVQYVDKATNLSYRWSGSAYIQLSPSVGGGSGATVSTFAALTGASSITVDCTSIFQTNRTLSYNSSFALLFTNFTSGSEASILLTTTANSTITFESGTTVVYGAPINGVAATLAGASSTSQYLIQVKKTGANYIAFVQQIKA
jgi:hypothetical protein